MMRRRSASSRQASASQRYAPRPGEPPTRSTTGSPSPPRTIRTSSDCGRLVRQATHVRIGTCGGDERERHDLRPRAGLGGRGSRRGGFVGRFGRGLRAARPLRCGRRLGLRDIAAAASRREPSRRRARAQRLRRSSWRSRHQARPRRLRRSPRRPGPRRLGLGVRGLARLDRLRDRRGRLAPGSRPPRAAPPGRSGCRCASRSAWPRAARSGPRGRSPARACAPARSPRRCGSARRCRRRRPALG